MKSILIFTVILCGQMCASAAHSPPVIYLSNVKSMLNEYRSSKNKFPSGWDEFISSGYLSGEILAQARKYCDIENRYYFIPPDKSLWILQHTERIVVMAKYSGMEGDRPEAMDENEVKGRWLIVEMANGEIRTRHYSEAKLKIMFSLSDLKLTDYTEEIPVGAQEKYETILNSGRHEKSIKDILFGSQPLGGPLNEPKKAKLGELTPTSGSNRWVLVCVIAVVLIAAVFVCIKFRAKTL